MTTPIMPISVFRSALIVTSYEGHAKIDRDFLKQVGILDTHHEFSGAEALNMLRQRRYDVVICDATLTDMDGQTFVTALRADPALATTPVILAMVAGRRTDVLEALKLGVAGFCLRPYSLDTFSKHLTMATHMAHFAASEKAALARASAREAAGDANGAAQAFIAVAETPDTAPRYFEEGMTSLAAGDFERAIMAFHKALAANKLYVEAHLGLARTWLAKGSTRQFRRCMKEAAASCARTRRFVELRDQFVTLLAADEAGFNPFLAIGNELLRDRHYTAAIALFRHALELAPKNDDAYLGLSRAYHFLRRPDLATRAIGKSLELNDRNEEARAIHLRLTGHNFGDLPPQLEKEPAVVDPEQYPLFLRGVLYLAGVASDALARSRRHQADAA